MHSWMNYPEGLDWLLRLEHMGVKLGLDNVKELLHRLGDPQEEFRSVHIAGTNGKGSVSAMIASILRAQGYRTGLYTSPHMVDFRERILTDGKLIEEGKLARLATEVRGQWEEMLRTTGQMPTFFEATTAIAFLHFADMGVEEGVIEVGMGGRLDATNVINPDCTVITNISLEHTQYLGDTLISIAGEKAGIIKPGVPVVTAVEQAEALEVIKQMALSKGAIVRVVGNDVTYRLVSSTLEGTLVEIGSLSSPVRVPLLGGYQAVNAATAYAAAIELDGMGVHVEEKAIIAGLQNVQWPGRLELIKGKPAIVLDASHTPEGARKVALDVGNLFDGDLTLIIGVLNDKDLGGVIGPFARISNRAIATSPATERAYPADVVAHALSRYLEDVEIEPDVQHAMKRATEISQADGIVLVTGSIYTIGEARTWLESNEKRPT
jgi:dihydrofolate synthase/folylpolyglutamate synthase